MSTLTAPPILESAAHDVMQFVGVTVEQYDWLIEQGKIAEDISAELIEGMIVKKDRSAVGEDPLTVGDRHRTAVNVLDDLKPEFRRLGCLIQCQQPTWIPPKSEPEPDLSVVLGAHNDYRNAKPAFGQVFSIIEVSENSLKRDLGTKLQMYAKGKMPEYIVVNLIDNVVLVHHNPSRGRYATPKILRAGDVLKISAGKNKFVQIGVAELL